MIGSFDRVNLRSETKSGAGAATNGAAPWRKPGLAAAKAKRVVKTTYKTSKQFKIHS